jgi:hypothetical protein
MKFYKVNGRDHYIVRDNGENYTYLYKSEREGGTYSKPFNFINCEEYEEISYPADFPEKWRPKQKEGVLGDSSPRIYTKFDESAAPLVQKLVEERGMGYTNLNPEKWFLGTGPNQSYDYNPPDGKENYKEVSLIEFLTSLAAIPVPFKPKIINILPWKIEVLAETVNIGCRKDVSKAAVQELIEEIDSLEGEMLIDIGDKEFDFAASRSGFRVDGNFVPWNTWDAFKTRLSIAFNKLQYNKL